MWVNGSMQGRAYGISVDRALSWLEETDIRYIIQVMSLKRFTEARIQKAVEAVTNARISKDSIRFFIDYF